MLIFQIHHKGGEEEAVKLKDCLINFDDSFKDDEPSTEIDVEELYGHIDATDELVKLAVNIAKSIPESNFSIEGCIDCSERSGEYQDFLIEYTDGKLIEKHSCWYIEMFAEDFESFEEFCEEYVNENNDPRFTEEQFEDFKKEQYYILESGDGDCVKEVPLDYVCEVSLEEQMICPVCGETLMQGVPICVDSDGVKYHIWCSEQSGKETTII